MTTGVECTGIRFAFLAEAAAEGERLNSRSRRSESRIAAPGVPGVRTSASSTGVTSCDPANFGVGMRFVPEACLEAGLRSFAGWGLLRGVLSCKARLFLRRILKVKQKGWLRIQETRKSDKKDEKITMVVVMNKSNSNFPLRFFYPDPAIHVVKLGINRAITLTSQSHMRLRTFHFPLDWTATQRRLIDTSHSRETVIYKYSQKILDAKQAT